MNIIYEPSGRAKEYCDLAVNLYKGCSHGCSYCYAPSATFTSREDKIEEGKKLLKKNYTDLQEYHFKGTVLFNKIKKEGYNVSSFDSAYIDPRGLSRFIPRSRVYGITGTALDIASIEAMAYNLKSNFPNSKIVVGGPISTAIDYLDRSNIDSFLIGEGDLIAPKILEDCLSDNESEIYYGESPKNLKGLSPAYHLWEERLGGNVLAEQNNLESAVILTSRGCPFNCNFCCSKKLNPDKVRFRDIDDIERDIKSLSERGVKVLRFSDENITSKTNHLEKVCDVLRKYHEKYGIVGRISSRVDSLDPELWDFVSSSGITEVAIGFESRDQRVLDSINKKITVEEQDECLNAINKSDMTSRVLMMTGCTGTNIKTLSKNSKFILSEDYDLIACTIYTPLPGTPVWENSEEFRCDLNIEVEDLSELCFYAYSPWGKRNPEPKVSLWDFPDRKLKEEAISTFALLESTGKVNKG